LSKIISGSTSAEAILPNFHRMADITS